MTARLTARSDFSALVLLSYLGLVLQLSSWQHDRAAIVKQLLSVLNRVRDRLPRGTLWVYHEARERSLFDPRSFVQAKLGRMQGRAADSIALLKPALEPSENGFKQAQALATFEMACVTLRPKRS